MKIKVEFVRLTDSEDPDLSDEEEVLFIREFAGNEELKIVEEVQIIINDLEKDCSDTQAIFAETQEVTYTTKDQMIAYDKLFECINDMLNL